MRAPLARDMTFSRRALLGRSGLASMSTVLRTTTPFAHLPLALADAAVAIPGKRGLAVLNDHPLNAEIPVHLLDDNITPAKYLFICNNGTRLLAAAPRTGRS